MDDRRFDALTRKLGQGGSRRTVLRTLLGLGGVTTAGAILSEAEAARRGYSGPPTATPQPTVPPVPTQPPTPLPPTATTVPTCPGNQTPCGSQCCCPAGNSICGYDCCPDGRATCCDGACCYGNCYGEELCCPTGEPVCSVDGCCQGGQCVVQGQFCCPDANVCGDTCCLASERCCQAGGSSACRACCSDTDCVQARCIDGACVPFTATPTVTPTDTPIPPTNTPTNTPTETPTSTPTLTPTVTLAPPLNKIWFSFIPDGEIGCCYCQARVELLGVQPNWTYEAFLYVWDGPGSPVPSTPVESQQISTDGNGAGLIVFNTDINNDDNSSNAQWARAIINGTSTGDFQQASCFNPATSTPTTTPTPTNSPTPTNTPTSTPTTTPPSTLTVELGLQIFGSLDTCMAMAAISGGQPATSYPASLFVWDGPGSPEPEQPIETIDILTFDDGTGQRSFGQLVANNTGQYAQVAVLGVKSGWTAVDSSTCEPS